MSQSIRENIKSAIAKRFSPAINFEAPYAKVMLDATINDIWNILTDSDQAVIDQIINRK